MDKRLDEIFNEIDDLCLAGKFDIANEAKKKELLNSAKSKLTKEEINALGLIK